MIELPEAAEVLGVAAWLLSCMRTSKLRIGLRSKCARPCVILSENDNEEEEESVSVSKVPCSIEFKSAVPLATPVPDFLLLSS